MQLTVVPALLAIVAQLGVVDDEIRSAHDIIAYDIGMSIPDSGSYVSGRTTIQYVVREPVGSLELDFDSVFVVDSVLAAGTRVSGEFAGERFRIEHWGSVGDTLAVTIYYRGVPSDGLFIQRNVRGRRTAFADNWPNRAHHWFPSEDHPSDKAFARFAIEVPAYWQAIANGRLDSVDSLTGGRTVWRWRTTAVIPVHTMVIGAGEMTVASAGFGGGVPNSVWMFVEDSAYAANGPFRRASDITERFTELIGPFPYAKIAHVQSSTRFGGMENSSAIFYTETGIAERRLAERTVAHEIAHQWFGDAITQYDWHHLWLSEGFATYFAAVYFELVGEDSISRGQLAEARRRYFESDDVSRPVIDTTITDLFGLLNRNSYQKGGLILHMLRVEVGDSTFFGAVREFYNIFRDSTALSEDFMSVVERNADRDLSWFFTQWLTQPGYPQLEVSHGFNASNNSTVITATQIQPEAWGTYRLDLPVTVTWAGGSVDAWLPIRGKRTRLTISGTPEQGSVLVDPEADFLLEVISRD